MRLRACSRSIAALLLAVLLPLQGVTVVSAAMIGHDPADRVAAGSHTCAHHAAEQHPAAQQHTAVEPAGSHCHHGCAGCCSCAAVAATIGIWQAPRPAASLLALPVSRQPLDVALERLDRPPRRILT